MARSTGKDSAARSMAGAGGSPAETDATPRTEGSFAGGRDYRGLVKDRRRFHRCALGPGGAARRRLVRSGASASFALRTRTSFPKRHSAKAETAIRRKNYPRRPVPLRLTAPHRIFPYVTQGKRGDCC